MARSQGTEDKITQEAAPPQASDNGQLKDIVVTAQRREESLNRVPLSVQAIGAGALAKSGVVDTTSLVQISPSVGFVTGAAAQSSGFLIRGVSSVSSEGGLQQSTAMIVDGVPLARPAEFVGDLGDIQRVEILPGPQGTLFGKNATAGVVNIVTKNPTSKLEAEAQAGATTDNEYSFRGMLNVPISDALRARVTGYYSHLSPKIFNPGTSGDFFGRERYGISAKVSVDLANNISLLLNADYRHSSDSMAQSLLVRANSGALGAQQVAIIGFTPSFGLIRANFDGKPQEVTEGYSASATFEWRASDRLTVTSVSSYRHFKSDQVGDLDDTPVGVLPGEGYSPNPANYPVMHITQDLPRYPVVVEYETQELRANYKDERFNIVGGVFLQTLNDRGRNIVPFIFDGGFILHNPALAGTLYYSATPTQYAIRNNTFAFFGDVSFKITEALSIFGGIRGTHETIDAKYQSESFFNSAVLFDPVTLQDNAPPVSTKSYALGKTTNNVSGRVGIQYQPTNNQNYYFSYNRGYKGPGVDVSRVAKSPDPASGYSPIVAAEIGSSFELGMKQTLFDHRVQVNLNLFRERLQNLQQNIRLPTGTDTYLINAGDLTSKGVEFDVHARPIRALELNTGLVYNQARYTGKDVYVSCYPGQTAADGCGTNGTYSIKGAQARGSYKWRYNVGATYNGEISGTSLNYDLYVGYNWFDKSPQAVGRDPLLLHPNYGLLDASLTVASNSGRWSMQIFGKNLTNKTYYSYLTAADGTIGRVIGFLDRDYTRYGGVRLNVKY